MSRTVNEILQTLKPQEEVEELTAPGYVSRPGRRLGLSVASMAKHMSNEGWLLFDGLREGGYKLVGNPRGVPETNSSITYYRRNVEQLVNLGHPSTLLIQDVREWDPAHNKLAKREEQYTHLEALKHRSDIFKVTVLKDSHQRPKYHRDFSDKIGCHAWVTYYHPDIVKRLAPYVRTEHLIRTTHTVDKEKVGKYSPYEREGTLLSGAFVGGVYPMRRAIWANLINLDGRVKGLQHPGYRNDASFTNGYLETLSKFKVAICTSSTYGYSLRKIIEATACGCRVITDLPEDDLLPEIDDNLYRINLKPEKDFVTRLTELIDYLTSTYHPDKQHYFSNATKSYYDYRTVGKRLAKDIENLRRRY